MALRPSLSYTDDLKIPLNEPARFQHLDALVTRDIEQMFVAADDDLCSACQGAGDEFVIGQVFTYRPAELTGFAYFRGNNEELQLGCGINARELTGKPGDRAFVLINDIGTDNGPELPLPDPFKDPERITGKEQARDQDIGIQDDPHFFCALAALTALATSDAFMPAFFAWARVCASSSSKSSIDGGWMTLKMSASLPSTTMNCVPGFIPRRFLVSSGMTTCPLEVIFVVEKLITAAPPLNA